MFLPALLAVLSISVESAQQPVEAKPVPAPASIQLPVGWDPGTRFTLEITKSGEEFREDGSDKGTKVGAVCRFSLQCEFTTRNGSGYGLRTTFGPCKVLDGPAEAVPLLTKLLGAFDGFTAELRTDIAGKPIELVAADDAEKRFGVSWKNAIDALALEIAKQRRSRTPPEPAPTSEQMNQISTEMHALVLGGGIGDWFLRQIGSFTLPMGRQFEIGKPELFESQLPNPFGPEPLPSRATMELSALRVDKNEAEIRWSDVLDPEKAPAVLRTSLRQIAKATKDASWLDEARLAALADCVRLDVRYVVDTKTGLTRSMEFRQEQKGTPAPRVDVLKIERIDSVPK